MHATFHDKVVLVTGGTRGIGRAVVESLARAGATVVFTYVGSEDSATAFTSALREQGCRVSSYKVDVRDDSAVAELMAMIDSEHGRLDVLVNNAGIIRDNLLLAMEASDWREVIETNLTGVYHCARGAAKLMMRRRTGAIINISSVAATRPGRGHCNYVASKGGLEAMTKALAVELAPRQIRVNAVAPGVIETDMSQEVRTLAGDQILERIPLKRYGKAEEVAHAVCFLASDLATYVTGTILHVDGGSSV